MREVSALYKRLRTATDSHYEVQVVRGPVTYGMRQIMSASVYQSLLSGDTGPSIGGTVSARCKLVLKESSANWPRMASFQLRLRLCSADDSETSEWLSMGTFYTDQRSEGKYGDLTIEAFDGMLLLNQYWTDKIPEEHMPASWPITAHGAAQLLGEATGIYLDSRDELDDTVAFVGLSTIRTAKNVWADIAAAHGCNAVLTPEGRIHLVPLSNGSGGAASAIAGIAIAGIAIVGMAGGGSGSGEDTPTYLGLAMDRLDTSPELPGVTGVELTDDAGYPASAGTADGYVLKAACGYSDSSAALLCLSKVNGYAYRPFDARNADLDPAAEPGDLVVIDDQTFQIMNIDWNIGAWVTTDLSAPVEYEVEHEYTVMAESASTLRKAMEADSKLNSQLRTYIEQTAREIRAGVAEQYVSDEALQDILEDLEGQTVSSVVTEYIVADSSRTAPAQDAPGWSTGTPAWTAGKYIWQRTVTTKADGTTVYSSPSCIQGAAGRDGTDGQDGQDGTDGRDGTDGVGISLIEEFYAKSTSGSTAPADSAFSSGVQTIDATNRYLWNYELITYTDSSQERTAKRVIGVYGDTGAAGRDGTDGQDGTDGVSITGVTNYYLATSASSGVTRQTSGWTDYVQSITSTNKYLWNYEMVSYSSGNPTYTDPVIIGVYGDTGARGSTGRGVSALTGQYTISTSSTTAPTTGWQNSCPAWEENKYIWTRTKIDWDDSTTSYTTPVIDDAINSASAQAAAANETASAVQQTLADNYSPTAEINEIFQTKSESSEQVAALQSEISTTNNSLTVAMGQLRTDMNGQFTAMAYYIRYENGVVIIGRTDQPTSVQIGTDQIAMVYGNEATSYWNQDKQRTPKQLEIPVGGSLRLGDLLWQPRSSGNLTLMFVGETEEEEVT